MFIKKITLIGLLTIASSPVLFPLTAAAQVFTPIVGNYSCAQLPDGKQILVKTIPDGFQLVNSAEVKRAFKKERNIIKQRIKLLNELLKGFERSRISKAKLINAINKKMIGLLGEDPIPVELPPDEAEAAVLSFKQKLLDRDTVLKTIGDLIKNCESGINPKAARKGQPIGVSVEAVSAVSERNEIHGGFVIHAPKLKSQFASKPGGYNVCVKLLFAGSEPGARAYYTGFGEDDLCISATSFPNVSKSVCDALLPKGRVGTLIKKRTYNFTSLPGVTTAELLDRIRLEVLQDPPIVAVIAFLQNISRDAAVKACEAF